MQKTEDMLEFRFVHSMDESTLNEVVLRMTLDSFKNYMADSLDDEKTKAYIATALPYLKERNKIYQLLQNNGKGDNQFNQSDVEFSTGHETHSRKIVLRKSRIKNIKENFLRNFMKWNTPICVKSENSEETFYIASKKFRKYKINMIRVSEKAYLAALLFTGRYEELAERASVEQIEELIKLGKLSPRITRNFIGSRAIISSPAKEESLKKSKKIIDKMNWGNFFK